MSCSKTFLIVPSYFICSRDYISFPWENRIPDFISLLKLNIHIFLFSWPFHKKLLFPYKTINFHIPLQYKYYSLQNWYQNNSRLLSVFHSLWFLRYKFIAYAVMILRKKWHLDGLSTRCKDVRREALKTTICLWRGKTFKILYHCHSTRLFHPVKR